MAVHKTRAWLTLAHRQYRAPLDEHGYLREVFAGQAVSRAAVSRAWDGGSQRGDSADIHETADTRLAG
jgi:hypothetical protein